MVRLAPSGALATVLSPPDPTPDPRSVIAQFCDLRQVMNAGSRFDLCDKTVKRSRGGSSAESSPLHLSLAGYWRLHPAPNLDVGPTGDFR